MQHESKDCDICLKEEAKTSRIDPNCPINCNQTKILVREILPKKRCWICVEEFANTDDQIDHFEENHECLRCSKFFNDVMEIRSHGCDFKQEYLQSSANSSRYSGLDIGSRIQEFIQ